jgi:hypothetical protein
MSIALLERAGNALGPLLDEVVFVGGATITLWITDPAAPAPRPTKDVDVVVEVTTLSQLDDFQRRLRDRHFREDIDSHVVCRWRYLDDDDLDDLILDAMPAAARLLGFENRWQAAALPDAARVVLPSGTAIRAIPPAYLVATKLEAFRSRGRGDHLGSRDLDDVVSLVDGRAELTGEIASSPSELRDFVAEETRGLLAHPRFVDAVFGFLRPDLASQARAEAVVLPRLRLIAAET